MKLTTAAHDICKDIRNFLQETVTRDRIKPERNADGVACDLNKEKESLDVDGQTIIAVFSKASFKATGLLNMSCIKAVGTRFVLDPNVT